MITAYCFFAYKSDHECLLQAIRSIRLSDPRGKIAVFDDGHDPLPKPPPCDFYEKTFFDRRGNLNGRECIMGEVLSFAKATRIFGAQQVAKVDCDTLLVDPLRAFRFAADQGADLCGASWHDFGVWGPFYILRASILNRMLDAINGLRDMSDEEDMGMTALVRATKGRVVIAQWQDGFFNGFDYRLRHFDFEKFRHTNAVTFGNRMQIDAEDPRAVIARAMTGLLDYLHSGKPFDWDQVMRGAKVDNAAPNPLIENVKKNATPAPVAVAALSVAAAPVRSEGRRESVAVIIIGHNSASYLDVCLTSVFAQTFKPDEVVYVDDASDDGSLEIAARFKEQGLRIIAHDRNLGMSAARMNGVEATTSALLLFVDSDNELPHDYLATMLEDLGTNDFVYPAKQFIGEGKAMARALQFHAEGKWTPCEAGRSALWRQNYADTCSLLRRDAFLAAGGWRENPADTMFDWDLFLRMSGRGPHARSSARLHYRVHENNWSERERPQDRRALNGLVRRHAASLTVATIWSCRIPKLRRAWIEAVGRSLKQAGKTAELLVLDDCPKGFMMPTRKELIGAFDAVNIRRIHRGVTTVKRRPDRRATAEFLSAACNDILRLASGDVLWFIEDDIIVPENAADELLKQLLQTPEGPCPAVGGCYRSRHQPDHWIAAHVIKAKVVHLIELPKEPSPIHFTGTGCLMVLRDLLGGVRFATEWNYGQLRSSGHDWCFAWALHQRGTPVMLVPDVVCRHHKSEREWF